MIVPSLEATREKKRAFISNDFAITAWEGLKPYFENLLIAEPATRAEFEAFLLKANELESIIQEDFAWRYIRMTCDTRDEERVNAYQFFVKEVMPELNVYTDKLNRKIVANPFFSELDEDSYVTYKRSMEMDIRLFREENIPLQTEEQSISQEYGAVSGAMTIEHEGQTLTLQHASKLLESHDRELRFQIWRKVSDRRKQDREKLSDIFGQLVALRDRIAENAGFGSYVGYKFSSLGRFDYDQADCHAFHDSIETVVKPVFTELLRERKERLGVNTLRPWDLGVGIFGRTPLKPFTDAPTLIDRTIEVLGRIKPELGQMIRLMDRMGYLDLDSRVGKAPGGYNYPLAEIGIPFIFMNAAGTQSDVTTMLHESGHAVHAFVTRDISLNALKRTPAEVAELASMTMELIAMDHYDVFYQDEQELIRAKKEQLQRCIIIFPWIATIDAFQMWVYDNPRHSGEERNKKWAELYRRFHGDEISWEGLEDELEHLWMKQGHIFDVPFYYIEYAMAQLGALAIWRNYKSDPDKGVDAYLNALEMGYRKTIPGIYAEAGIKFAFSGDYVKDIVKFCLAEYQALEV